MECCSTICCNTLPNKNFLASCTSTDSNIIQQKDLGNDHNSPLSLKPSNLELLVHQFNNATPEKNDPEKFIDLNIMKLRKCITLKYPSKINCYSYSI